MIGPDEDRIATPAMGEWARAYYEPHGFKVEAYGGLIWPMVDALAQDIDRILYATKDPTVVSPFGDGAALTGALPPAGHRRKV